MTAVTQRNDDPKVLDDRTEQILDLGFSFEESKALATARNADGNYWRIGKIQRMISHPDCDHALVVDLLT